MFKLMNTYQRTPYRKYDQSDNIYSHYTI